MLYVDADWLHETGIATATMGITVAAGRLFWNDAPDGAVAVESADADARAAELLVEYSRRIAAAIGEAASVKVAGSGALSDLVRRQLPASVSRASATPPAAVAVLTSDPRAIVAALLSVADLGILVLACPANPGCPLDLYGDLHRRGLRVVGVPRPLPGEASSDAGTDAPILRELVSGLVDVASPENPPGRGWFRTTRNKA